MLDGREAKVAKPSKTKTAARKPAKKTASQSKKSTKGKKKTAKAS
jgi:hypothetical protein